jgi:hypothetical protein
VDADGQAAVQRRRVRGRRRRELALELEDDAVTVDALEQRMPCVLPEETPRERIEVDEENAVRALRQPRERQRLAAARPCEQPLDRPRNRRERERRWR